MLNAIRNTFFRCLRIAVLFERMLSWQVVLISRCLNLDLKFHENCASRHEYFFNLSVYKDRPEDVLEIAGKVFTQEVLLSDLFVVKH